MRPRIARIIRLTGALGVMGACAMLAACSQTPGYPTLPAGDVIGQKTLTPAQQDAEIKELSDAQVQNTAQADPASEPPKYIPASVSETE